MTLSEKELSIINDPKKWEKVESSNLKEVLFIPGENSKRGRLFIRFKDNKVYFYEEVPKSTYKGLLKAESKGKYFYQNIKFDYSCYLIK